MAITPARLKRVATDHLPADELKARWRVTDIWTRYIPQHVRLATTRGARAGSAKALESEVRFFAIIPLQGELGADELNVL